MTAVSSFFVANKAAIQLIGGLILIAFGLRLVWARPGAALPADGGSGLVSNTRIVPQTFFLTISNPGAILGVFAFFGGVILMGFGTGLIGHFAWALAGGA